MRVDIELYSQDHGQRVRLNTWCDDISTSTDYFVRWKRESTGETHQLDATVVPVASLSRAAKRAIVCVIPENWLKDKLGLWTVTARLTWSDASICGDPVTVLVKRHPTVTTTTTSTTS